jgi:starch phosphorylase
MKFALNGALTIGTWDGANIEMAEAFGPENMFCFGLRTEAVAQMKALGYDPRLFVEENRQLAQVMEAIASGAFSGGDRERYRALVDSLLGRDVYMLMADFKDYVATQARVDALFAQPEAWARQAVLNVAGMGWFSADRTITEYVDRVWSLKSLS